MSWCPTADCKFAFIYDPEDDGARFVCPTCNKEYCLQCRVPYHVDMNCEEYQINSTELDVDKKFLKFAKGKKYKQCPKCDFWIERSLGCNSMRCRCGTNFCYKCGGEFPNCLCA